MYAKGVHGALMGTVPPAEASFDRLRTSGL